VEETVEDDKVITVFEELEKFVYYLANGAHDPNNPLMNSDEISGELFLELVKGVQYYQALPMEQLLTVIKRMMDNRLSELVYKYYVTHRKAMANTADIDALETYEENDGPFLIRADIQIIADVSMQLNPELLAGSSIRMQTLRERLSYDAIKVMDAMMYGNELLYSQIVIAEIRAKEVLGQKSHTPRVYPWQVADSLGMDEQRVRECIKEIKEAYKQVLHES